jgi:hypothetical protein
LSDAGSLRLPACSSLVDDRPTGRVQVRVDLAGAELAANLGRPGAEGFEISLPRRTVVGGGKKINKSKVSFMRPMELHALQLQHFTYLCQRINAIRTACAVARQFWLWASAYMWWTPLGKRTREKKKQQPKNQKKGNEMSVPRKFKTKKKNHTQRSCTTLTGPTLGRQTWHTPGQTT